MIAIKINKNMYGFSNLLENLMDFINKDSNIMIFMLIKAQLQQVIMLITIALFLLNKY